MPRKSAPTKKALQAENERLRSIVDTQARSQKTLSQRLSAMNPHRAGSAELWVGIRNVSDVTIGQESPFPNEPDLHLYADLGTPDPNQVAVVSYAWWQQLRKGRLVAQGLIMRDDTILGSSYAAAPDDRPGDLVAGWEHNLVPDPQAWIDEKDEVELRAALDRVTSTATLHRLRRVIDRYLTEAQEKLKLDPLEKNRAKKALRSLPAKYQLVDQLITMRLEGDED
jgi:hypothetical protein